MKKVSELEGAELDYWVAKALGAVTRIEKGCYPPLNLDLCWAQFEDYEGIYTPSVDWSSGGPIIERRRITLNTTDDEEGEGCWVANIPRRWGSYEQFGTTALIAAMRCFVASKFGDEVG